MNSTTTELTTMDRATPPAEVTSVTQIEQQRAVQEIQGMLISAKRFPRDEIAIYEKIIKACSRRSLAEVAQYVYPKGGSTVQGPSIRLAETLARLWGNLLYGTQELSRHDGWSEMEAYCWDLESNTRRSIKFVVEHTRWTKKGSYALEDPREVYELTANQGARRVRACILGIIPADVVEAAEERCNETLKSSGQGPIEDRIKTMVTKFAEVGVAKDALEKRLGHKLEVIVEAELVVLRKIYASIKDGMGKREDYFDISGADVKAQTEHSASELKDRLRQQREAKGQTAEEKDIPTFGTLAGKESPIQLTTSTKAYPLAKKSGMENVKELEQTNPKLYRDACKAADIVHPMSESEALLVLAAADKISG